MTLIKSISGIRGTIGGIPGENLTPPDIVKFAAAFTTFILRTSGKNRPSLVIGRDARVSGVMISDLITSTVNSLGADVIDLALSTTPTVEMAVAAYKADGGIIITASHNPANWNALKLLNSKGEFISALEGTMVLELADKMEFNFVTVDKLGNKTMGEGMSDHFKKILALPLVRKELIAEKKFSIAVDGVNSSGGIFVPAFLNALDVTKVEELYCEPNGMFAHNPEPLPEHLTEISRIVREKKCDLGIVVDPDVDRLAIVCEDGSMFGEEYTLVAVADYVIRHTPGNTVSNLSSTRALRDITEQKGLKYHSAAVGEVNVVAKMKEVNAVIGGEGNGGIIYPELHYGRDALAGIGLFLSALAESGKKASEFRDSFPKYVISKNKIELPDGVSVESVFEEIIAAFPDATTDLTDGLKLDFPESWVHLRKSNTEPIVRIYAEAQDENEASSLANKIILEIKNRLTLKV